MAFQRFNRANDVVENQRTTISSGLWSGGSAELTAFYTQSTNGNITGSFLELYNEDPNLSSSAEVQFAVALPVKKRVPSGMIATAITESLCAGL